MITKRILRFSNVGTSRGLILSNVASHHAAQRKQFHSSQKYLVEGEKQGPDDSGEIDVSRSSSAPAEKKNRRSSSNVFFSPFKEINKRFRQLERSLGFRSPDLFETSMSIPSSPWVPFFDVVTTAPASLSMEDSFSPLMDIRESSENYELSADLPGITKDNIKVEYNEKKNLLTISGETSEKREEKEHNYHMVERRKGSFLRSISLPENTDKQGIKAEYKDGVLMVTIPKIKTEESEQQSKPIKVE